MRAGFINKSGAVALLTASLGLAAFQTVVAGGGPGEKIEFSEVPAQGTGQSPVVVSNMNRLSTSPSGFNQVKEDLMRPFSSLDPLSSLNMPDPMGGQFGPLPQPSQTILSRHAQQLLDEKRNWAFSAYEELFSTQDQMEKKMFGIKEYGDDGREKKQMTVVDKYYDSLTQNNLSATNQDAQAARAEFIIENGFDPLGKTFSASDPFVRKMFGAEDPDSLADKASGEEFPGFSTGNGPALGSPDEIRMTQQRLDNLRRNILGDAASRFGGAGQFNPLAPHDPGKNPAEKMLNQDLQDAMQSKPKSATPFLAQDPTANVLHSRVNDDLTARALGLPNPVAAATNNVRPAPTAQSIQAEWDPFGANRPKPKF
jgi:hypothetical protein